MPTDLRDMTGYGGEARGKQSDVEMQVKMVQNRSSHGPSIALGGKTKFQKLNIWKNSSTLVRFEVQ